MTASELLKMQRQCEAFIAEGQRLRCQLAIEGMKLRGERPSPAWLYCQQILEDRRDLANAMFAACGDQSTE